MSRAGDPQLHTHVLVANLLNTADGRWLSLDGQRLYRRAKTAGYLYQAQLRLELSAELGLSFREVRRGAAEVEGVPDETLRTFSRRRAEVEAQMSDRGTHSAKAAQVAALSTRKAKDRGLDVNTLRIEWRDRARESGFEASVAVRPRGQRVRRIGESRLFSDVEAGLTAKRSTFARRHVMEELAGAHRRGASVDEIEALADRFLVRSRVVELGAARPANARAYAPSEPIYTTREVLALEDRLVRRAEAHARSRMATADRRAIEAALRRDPALGADQRELVRCLASEGQGTLCVLGRAGAGKTRALRPLREAFEASGVEVIGASTQNTAARILEAEAGIRSTSITRLLYEADIKGYGLPRNAVVVIDEAAMASTRDLSILQELAIRARARLILVGDPAQLPAIRHPGAFRALVDRLEALELNEMRRLTDPVERAAADAVRAGRGSAAITAYHERGRLTLHDSVAELEAQVVAGRHRAQSEGADAIIVARTRARVRALNEAAQAKWIEAGQLEEESIEVGPTRIHAGDLVVTRANRGGAEPVHNRERWVVEVVDAESRTLTLHHMTERNRVVTLDGSYIDRHLPDATGPVELGYAITRWGAQGMTVDRAFVVMTDGLTKEDAYVALTRARQSTQLYALAREPIERAEFAPASEERNIELQDLGMEVERSTEGALAIDERLRGELEHAPTAELVAELAGAASEPGGWRAAAIERALAERRRATVEAALALQPRYIVDTLGPRPAGVHARLEWERAVDRVEVLRQRLGVRDRERALGKAPRQVRARVAWRQAAQEIEALRVRIAERGASRQRRRSAGIGLEL